MLMGSAINSRQYKKKPTLGELLGKKKSTVLSTFAICGLQMALTVFRLTQRWLFMLCIRHLLYFFLFPCSKIASAQKNVFLRASAKVLSL